MAYAFTVVSISGKNYALVLMLILYESQESQLAIYETNAYFEISNASA